MTKTIKVQINCGEKTCDDCHFVGYDYDTDEYYGRCNAFRSDLDETKNNYKRCMPCLAGEVEE